MKEWTIMVYMAGDNNLSIEMVYALEQLKAVAQNNRNINLYVYFDGLSSEVPTLYCDFSESCESSDPNCPVNFYQSYKIKNKLIDVAVHFNENSAAVNNIINFVDWCVKKDSAEDIKRKKYAFIFSGHSFGFLNWGLFRDEKSGYYMTHPKLKYMFERITSTEEVLLAKAAADEAEYQTRYNKPWNEKLRTERTTPVLGKSLDILGFDSCVMSTLELGCQFRKFAKTMVASEGSIPTAGWNYAQILLGRIKENPNSEAKDIAVSFVDEFIKQQNKFALADISVDISAWDLSSLPNLEANFAELADNLLECFKDKESVDANQLRRLLVYAHWQCQTYMLEQHIDLGDFCQILIKEIELLEREFNNQNLTLLLKVKESCKKVVENIKECILLTGFSGSDFQFSNGISLFFPWSFASYQSARDDYENLSFIEINSAGKKWNEFLKVFLGDITLRRSTPLTQTDESEHILTSSIIYESYANMDEKTANTNGSNNSGDTRQPPNSGRQPPNSGRMLNELNIFLSRFMRLKNYQSNWNRAGFTSKKVGFKPTSELTSKIPIQSLNDMIVIEIPKPRSIEKQLDEIISRLHELGRETSETVNIEEYTEQLKKIIADSDEPTTVRILGDLSKSNFLKSNGLTGETLKIDLDNTFSNIRESVK